MKNSTIIRLLVAMCVAAFLSTFAAAQSGIEIKLRDGSRWRGSLSQEVRVEYMQNNVQVSIEGKLSKSEPLYIAVDGLVAGNRKQVIVMKADIVTMKTLGEATVDDRTSEPKPAPKNGATPANASKGSGQQSADTPTEHRVQAFLLPLDGPVGPEMRAEEIKRLGEYIDRKYGSGQTIVLKINTDGGASVETQKIGDVIKDLRRRHRVVAWVEKAISAGCHTAMYCHEIYFMRQGTAGSVTTWSGNMQAVRGEHLEKILEDFVRVAEENGYSRHVALSMKLNQFECSYDKDEETGVVTFYGDLSGKYILSDKNSNLCFTASNAEHCGFSKGTADTVDDLAKLLKMQSWYEPDDYGRKIAAEWKRTCDEAKRRIPILVREYDYKNISTGDEQTIIGTRINLLNELLSWWKRAPNLLMYPGLSLSVGVPPVDVIERELRELQKRLGDIRRANR